MSCAIRKAVASDASTACDVVRRSILELCIDDHRGDSVTLAEWLENKTPSNFELWIQSHQHVAMVGERSHAVVGFGLLNVGGDIALLYVAPEARFSGVSKALLFGLERAAVDLGMKELQLESSLTALQFYQSAGYMLTRDPVAGFGVTSCYPMSRTLESS